MTDRAFEDDPRPVTRREVLSRAGMGIGGVALATLFHDVGLAGGSPSGSPLAAKQPHFAPKAKRVIQIFCAGGPSHLDTFDPKPLLATYEGTFVDDVVKDVRAKGREFRSAGGAGVRLNATLKGSPFAFKKHGQSGMEISELFPKLATHADELCVVRSMQTKSPVHEAASLLMHTGDFSSVRPSVGAWTVYGLGTENENLPALVGLTANGSSEGAGDRPWGNAFLPAWCNGTGVPTGEMSVTRMIENLRSGSMSLREQRRQIDLLREMHEHYATKHPGQTILDGRVQAFETAFRMQVEAGDAFDISREPKHVRDLYGDAKQGRPFLLARRLVERGVRFVQVWHSGWDTHDMNDQRHRELAAECDQPLHALLVDLKERDMLKDTLVIWGGEFGRTPTTDKTNVNNRKGVGRDHHANGFTIWMAGGGVRPGTVYGATDEFGGAVIENGVDIHDLHATILHLLGFDHERLTYRYAGRDFRLTDVHGRVVRGLLA
ncbi:MAG: DUF1501 domain-containing protein [Planctomycetia bacterium]